ncbi:MAG: Tol-Pal system protein TolB [Holosporales bacterium]|nr:Tol-Pal system protein TolB [Holosporales bacterium]
MNVIRMALCLVALAANAFAIKIEINKGKVSPDPIAIVEFYDRDGNDSKEGSEIAGIVSDDLQSSGLFIIVNKASFLEDKKILCSRGPNIKNWNVLNARFLVYGKISGGFNPSISFTLVDVVAGTVMLNEEVSGKSSELRGIAHRVADIIYKRVTNDDGYFDSKIIYVETSDNSNPAKRKTRLVQIDQDGYNRKTLTDGRSLAITPRYGPNGVGAYILYDDSGKGILGKSAHVYTMNFSNGSSKLMISKELMSKLVKKNHGNPVQMTYAPRFSPDGQRAVFALIIDGNSAIYKIDLAANRLTQLTEHTCIDTSPCYSRDGKRIIFTSNRQGKEAVYMMNEDGSDAHKISQGDGKYSQPNWSPRDDLIAFSKQHGGRFSIGVMKPDGSGERLIISRYMAEAPDWLLNGRYIAFSGEARPGAKSELVIIDITGYHTRVVKTNGDASYPACSPRIAD